MSERRWPMEEIMAAIKNARDSNDSGFVGLYAVGKALESLPAPEEQEAFERKVWCNKDVKEISHSGASWYFSPEGKAHAAYPHALTVTYRDGHHD